MALQAIVALIGVILMACPTETIPVCDWQDIVTRCSIEQQSDFAALPTNVTSLSVYFPSGHKTVLSDKVFPVRPNLQTLVVDLNNVNNDPQGNVFIQLTALTEITIINSDIYAPRELKLPAMFFTGLLNLRRILMIQVGLSQVHETTFHNLPSLETLNLDQNHLTTFPGAAFTGSTNIVEIVLSNNKLSALVDGTFDGLSKLHTLSLDYNNLQLLEKETFRNLAALNSLILENNNLRSIGVGTFQQLPLTTLKIQNNKLGQIDANIFSGLSSLEILDIGRNNLTEISDLAFSDLKKLKFLEIFENSLKMLSVMTFQGLTKLVYLDLYSNEFINLQDDIFRDLTKLTTLHLHKGKIQRISVGAFNGLATLHILTLAENNMTTLPIGVFDGFQELGLLDISHNPWDCTCKLTWLHPWSDGQNIQQEIKTKCAIDGESLLQYARDNYYNCLRMVSSTTAGIGEDTTSITFPSAVDSGQLRGNGSIFGVTSLSKTDFIVLISVASVAFVLAVIIAVLIIYCRQKKCAFWTPEHVSAIPTTPASAGLEKNNHFVYSPTKDQTFFNDQADRNQDRKAKLGSDRHQGLDSAYDNPALYVEDVFPNLQPADPAVIAYVSENGVMHRNGDAHSYEHRVSDSGTHYVNKMAYSSPADDDIRLNDLSPPEDNTEIQPKNTKKEKKRKHGKKSKKSSASSSENGHNDPYREVYAPPTDIPPPKMTPTPAPRPSLQKKHHVHDTSMDNMEYNTPDDYIDRGLERDSALGASTEEPFEDQPASLDLERENPPLSDHFPEQLDQAHYPEGDDGEDQDHRRLQHTDSLGLSSDYMDYRHSFSEDKPLY